MKPTPEQEKIINANFDDILVINAYAGCGKTSTLYSFCAARSNYKILYLAYNKSMADEAKRKFADLPHVEAKTMHSLAYHAIGIQRQERLHSNISLNALDVFEFVDKEFAGKEFDLKTASDVVKMLRFFVNSGHSDFEACYAEFADSIETEAGKETLVEICNALWRKILTDDDMPYEHDFYMKEYQLSKTALNYDFILVDEAQDTNDCVLNIVLAQKAKKVFIGDRFQMIYSFRGACGAMQKLSDMKSSLTLELSHSFRCSKEIAYVVNPFLLGAGAKSAFIGLNTAKNATKQRAIISRTNAGVLRSALDNMDAKIYFVGGLKSYNFEDLKQIVFLMMSDKNPNARQYVTNQFLQKFSGFKDLKNYISESGDLEWKSKLNLLMFAKTNIFEALVHIKNNCVKRASSADVILTTAHKSKGLEWECVELNDDFPCFMQDMRDNKTEAISREELHLFYVALTRAKTGLMVDPDYLPSSPDEAKNLARYLQQHVY